MDAVQPTDSIPLDVLNLQIDLILKAVPVLSERIDLWEVGVSRGATREAFAGFLGPAHYVERDGTRTCGGEEDTWRYQLPSAELVFLVYRVPYLDGVVISSKQGVSLELQKVLNLMPGSVQVYDKPYPLHP